MTTPHVYDHSGSYENAGEGVLDQCRKMLLGQHLRITHCLGQLSDAEAWWRPRPEMNAIGNLLLHLRGNVGQWIVNGAGGRPFERNRPAEFAADGSLSKAEAESRLTAMVYEAVDVLAKLEPESLLDQLVVQGIETSRLGAVLHATAHFEGHAQEIVCLTRQQIGENYQPLWVPQSPAQASVGADSA